MVFETITYASSVTGAVVRERHATGDRLATSKAHHAGGRSVADSDSFETTDAAIKRVLIAEDEALIRLDLREMLQEEGFDVVGEAADGEQAVELAVELNPDLVICDVKMPKMDGIAAAAQIAAKRIAPVVILTAFSQRDLIERARDAGAMAYLVKPFQKRDLLPAIEMATSRFAEIRALESEVTNLRERLEARKLIERAKGVLMTEHRMTEPEAFRWIQRAAMDNRTSMRAVAELVLSGGT
jgi:AmiR/NasT family two-component response regulator